jgi:hypothetical protein
MIRDRQLNPEQAQNAGREGGRLGKAKRKTSRKVSTSSIARSE